MPRTTIRHGFSALAAVALVSAFASPPASAGGLQNTERELVDALQTSHPALDKPTFGEKFKMGLTAEKGRKAVTSIISGFNSLER